jgi:hypothetical protein
MYHWNKTYRLFGIKYADQKIKRLFSKKSLANRPFISMFIPLLEKPALLGNSVTAAQLTLDQLVLVRIQVPQFRFG